MNELTLKEVCGKYGVSRRAVQGYEQAKLVSFTGRNKYGYLLYNQEAQERICMIKRYQEFGFTINEIRFLIDSEPEEKRKMLVKQRDKLKEEIIRLEQAVSMIGEMI